MYYSGIGNSAVDIAVDLSHVASQVYLSTRRGAWVISRIGFWGLPADAMANNRFLFSLPHSVLEWSVEKMANFRFDHESYGLKPKHRYAKLITQIYAHNYQCNI